MIENYLNLKVIIAFAIGSSPIGVFPIYSLIGTLFRLVGRPSDIAFEQLIMAIPLLMGFFSMINYRIINDINLNSSLAVGAIAGISISMIGLIVYDLPSKLFKLNPYLVHFISIILFMIIYRLLITPITYLLLMRKNKN